MKLIGLAGRARTGKSTVAALLSHHGFLHYAFADPIRRGVRAMLNLSHEQLYGERKEAPIDWLDGITPRRLMQTLGTEWGRDCAHRDVWVRLAQREWQNVRDSYTGCPGLVISDVRFENEAKWIREAGGQVWHVLRGVAPAVECHRTEDGIAFCAGDEWIDNNGTFKALADCVAALLNEGCGDEVGNDKESLRAYRL